MRLPAPTARRRHRFVGAGVVLAVLLGGLAAPLAVPSPAAAAPSGPTTTVPAPDPVDAYPAYEAQTTCDPTVKPGAAAVLTLVLEHYKVGRSSGITRACGTGGQSEHKEGRAFDWGLSVHNPAEKAAGDAFVEWVTADGPDGRPGYHARRLGVMYVIWNKRIWTAYTAKPDWRTYYGASPHTDHVHVSLSRKGAAQQTSWWTGSTTNFTVGSFERVSATAADLTVHGWAMDPDTAEPIDVHVYVDGVGRAIRADRPRPDVAAVYRRGERLGFTATLPQARGPHSVCVYAIDPTPVGNTLLGCRTVVVQDQAPRGVVEVVQATHSSITVSGWALDPDTSAPIDVHAYLDGRGTVLRADQSRPDVGQAHGLGDRHGFSWTVPATVGRHDLCLYAMNSVAGPSTVLHCRSVTVEPAPTAAPVGSLDGVTPTPTGVHVHGWAVDPDTTAPTDIHVYADGVGSVVRADRSRPDVAAALRLGDRHGFEALRTLSGGFRTVGAYAINTGAGPNTLLGCRDVTVNHAPIGSVDWVTASAGTVTVGGWALDQDTSDPTDVHVYVDGVGAAVRADSSRGDVAAAFGKGDRHGFTHSRAVAPGRHTVCVHGIDTALARHALLGCRTVDVPA